MSWLILFAWAYSSCKEHKPSEIYCSVGLEPTTLGLGRQRHVLCTMRSDSSNLPIQQYSGSIPRNACVACETKLCKVWQTDGQTDKVIPMCRYASQATQKHSYIYIPRGIGKLTHHLWFFFKWQVAIRYRLGISQSKRHQYSTVTVTFHHI